MKDFLAFKKWLTLLREKTMCEKRVGQIRPQATSIPQCVKFAVFALGGYDLQSPTISLVFVVESKFTNQ